MIALKYQKKDTFPFSIKFVIITCICYCVKYIITPHVYSNCCQRRYIIEPEKLIYHGKFRVLFFSIDLEKSKFN